MAIAGADVMVVLAEVAAAVRGVLDGLSDWGPAGTTPGQYFSDLAADEVAVRRLLDAGFSVLSEESGEHAGGGDGGVGGLGSVLVVVDPVDGSTNASRGIPWWATSLCALDADGPLAALVVNQATGQRFEAVRGEGAWSSSPSSGRRRLVVPVGVTSLASSVVLLSGFPAGGHLGWKQFRALGAAALDLCAVAAGVADAWVDCSRDAHGAWDYLGGMLVCSEAGAPVADLFGRDLVVRSHAERRTPVAAATGELLAEVVAALGGSGGGSDGRAGST